MKMQTYFKSFFSIVLIMMTLGIGIQTAAADSRNGNMSLYLLIDRSLSMEQEIGSVKTYLEETVAETLLQTGDFVYVLAFYGDTQFILQGRIGSELSVDELMSNVTELKANRHYTDIGSMLDSFEGDFRSSAAPPTAHPYVLLLSDNYHEGPPDSPYPGKTHNLEHPLLVPRKEIPMDGWKISILGITVEEKAQRFAAEITAAWNQRN
ncbi:MAG: hypothetical protein ACOCW5_00680 [Spirochaetia bacterium]